MNLDIADTILLDVRQASVKHEVTLNYLVEQGLQHALSSLNNKISAVMIIPHNDLDPQLLAEPLAR